VKGSSTSGKEAFYALGWLLMQASLLVAYFGALPWPRSSDRRDLPHYPSLSPSTVSAHHVTKPEIAQRFLLGR
jgi:hypothetical protein